MTCRDRRWSPEEVQAWYANQAWHVGCNFLPSTAINQMEMWSAESFDAETIERELDWARDAGFDTMRVYLHDRAWAEDPNGFLDRMDRYLAIAADQGICTLFVIFDDCWHEPEPGPPPAPRPGVHNSGWLQSPGRRVLAAADWEARLEPYVRAVVERFAEDLRVLAWDLFNEPTNDFLPILSLTGEARDDSEQALAALRAERRIGSFALLDAAFRWARAARPSQPLTAGIWSDDPELNERLAELSDVISFHHYRSGASLERQIERLRAFERPIFCTEYLARTTGCTFQSHLPTFQRERVACWNWGLVDGKSQTKYSWTERLDGEPEVWFHDVFERDGRPWRRAEVDLIRSLTGRP